MYFRVKPNLNIKKQNICILIFIINFLNKTQINYLKITKANNTTNIRKEFV